MKNKTILIVEDEVAQLNVLADEFVDQGFSVIKSSNGEEGLDTALSKKPDIILLDLLMPIMDGMTMMKKVRAEGEWGKRVPIMILTNLIPEEERMKKITHEKPAHYLVKSIWPLSEIVGRVNVELTKTA